MKAFPVFLTLLLLVVHVSYAQVFDLVVAQDGTGDYTSIGSAISRIRSTDGRHLIFVKAGTYREKINIAFNNISLIGEDVDRVIISWDDYSGDADGNSTSSSYTVEVSGDGFYAENITFSNTAGDVGQAVAVSTTGNHQIFKNCRFLGFQDTYYAKQGMQFITDTYIEGATDFIFGESTAVFQDCEIHCLEGGQFITAPADTKLISEKDGRTILHGLLFLDCKVTAEEGVPNSSYYLGRPWQSNSSSVYINSSMGDHIREIGWSTWNDNNHQSAFFAEYQSVDLSGTLIDVSKRADWSIQLATTEVENYYNRNFYLNGWDPLPATIAPEMPQRLEQDMLAAEEGFSMTWSAVDGAIGYIIYKNDSTLGFSTETFYEDGYASFADTYQVRAVGEYGTLSGYSSAVKAVVITSTDEISDPTYKLENGQFTFSEPLDISIYSFSGQVLIRDKQIKWLNVSHLQKGMYVIVLKNSHENVSVKKVAL